MCIKFPNFISPQARSTVTVRCPASIATATTASARTDTGPADTESATKEKVQEETSVGFYIYFLKMTNTQAPFSLICSLSISFFYPPPAWGWRFRVTKEGGSCLALKKKERERRGQRSPPLSMISRRKQGHAFSHNERRRQMKAGLCPTKDSAS